VVRLIAAHHGRRSSDIRLWALQAADDKS
jgi:hypothetical protein